MKLNKILMMVLMMIGVVAIVSAEEWTNPYEYGLGNNKFQGGSGDIIFSTYTMYSFDILNGTALGYSEPMIGNVYGGNSYLEMVVHGECGLSVVDTSDRSLIAQYKSICDTYAQQRHISGMTLYDWDGDNREEIILSAYDSIYGYFMVIDMSNYGSFSVDFSNTLTYPTQGKTVKCYDDYCYIQDVNSNFYRFAVPSGTRTQINVGSLSNETREAYLGIYNCDSNNAGLELIGYGDFDLDGYMDDVVLVNLTNFAWYKRYFGGASPTYPNNQQQLSSPPTCGAISGVGDVIGLSAHITQTGYNGDTHCWCHSRDEAIFVNVSTMTKLGERGDWAQVQELYDYNCRYGNCPACLVGDCSYERNSDGYLTPSHEYSQISFNMVSNLGCGWFFNVYRCINVTDGTIVKTTATTTQQTDDYRQKGCLISDIDNDDGGYYTNFEALCPRGKVVNYDAGSLTFETTLPITTECGWVGAKDYSSYTDYYSIPCNLERTYFAYEPVMYVDNYTYYQYTDDITEIPNVTNTNDYATGMTPSDEPATKNVLMTWTLTIVNESNPTTETKSAFDCDNDGSLEFGWANRGISPVFNCTYSSTGTKTARAWTSDDFNYPDNLSITDTVNVIDTTMNVDWNDVGNYKEHTYATGAIGDVDDLAYNLYNYSIGSPYQQQLAWGENDYNFSYNAEVVVGDVVSGIVGYEVVVADSDTIYLFNSTLGLLDTYSLNDTDGLASQWILYDFDEDGYEDIIFLETIDEMLYGTSEWMTILKANDGTMDLYMQKHIASGNTERARNKVPHCNSFSGNIWCYVMTEQNELIGVENTGFMSVSSVTPFVNGNDFRYNVLTTDQFDGTGAVDIAGWTYDSNGIPYLFVINGDTLNVETIANLSQMMSSSYSDSCRLLSPVQISNLIALSGFGVIFTANCHDGNGASQFVQAFMGVLDNSDTLYKVFGVNGTYDGTATSKPIELHISQPIIIDFQSGGGDEMCAFVHALCNGDTDTDDCGSSWASGVDTNWLACEIEQAGWDDNSLWYSDSYGTYNDDMGLAVTVADIDYEDNNPSVADGVYDFISDVRIGTVGSNYERVQLSGDSFDMRSQTDLSLIQSVANRKGRKTVFQQSIYADILFLDDSYLFLYTDELTGYNGTNSLPYINDMFATPNPTYPNISTGVYCTITDPDNSPSEVKSAFDCNNDGSLEFGWANRGTSPIYNCTYTSIGDYTSKCWISDNINYPANASGTEIVHVIESAGCIGSCSGFIAPICVGTCEFKDDFDYAPYCITCNGWSGYEKQPQNETLWLANLNSTHELYLDRTSEPINDWEWNTFSFEFDFNDNENDRTMFYVYDAGIDKVLSYLYWENGVLYEVDGVPPYTESISSYSLNQWYHLKGVVDFPNNKVTYYFNYGAGVDKEFQDTDATSAGYYAFNWLYHTSVDMRIDNFTIIRISENVNGTPPSNTSFVGQDVSYLTTGNLCAINWSNHRFIQSECELRGYSMKPEFSQLCLIRACVSDGFTYVYTKARADIFRTLIIVIAIILIAPLLVMLLAKRK